MIEEELSPVYTTPDEKQNTTPEVEFPAEIPQQMNDVLGDEFAKPALEAEEAREQERVAYEQSIIDGELEKRRTKMGAIEAEMLDTRERTENERVDSVRDFVAASEGKSIRSSAQLNSGMDKVWSSLGGEGIAPSVDAVYYKLQEASVKNKQTNDKAKDMFKQGTTSVFSASPTDPSFELMTTPMSKAERKQFSDAYNKGSKAQVERFGASNIASYHTILEQVNSGVDFDDIAESVADTTLAMDGEQKINYLTGMREALATLPAEKRQQLITRIGNNARISLERAGDMVSDSTKTAIKGVRGAMAGFFNESQKQTNPIAKQAQLLYETATHYTDMERSAKDILMSQVEPLDYVTDENSIGRLVEEGVYQIPQVAASIGVVAAPMILSGVAGLGGAALNLARGTSAVAGFSMSANEVMESKRQGYLAGGADFDTASNKANSLATYGQALPHFFIERMQAGGLVGKSPLFDKLIGKLDGVFKGTVSRRTAKFFAQGGLQTTEEMAQNIYTELVKDVTNVFDNEMSDVVWSNGTDGVFDEFWAQSAVTFISMSPFAAFSAGGMMSAESRASEWAKLPELHLKAYGYDQKSIENLKNADNPRDRSKAYNEAQATRDGFSDDAKEATDEINQAILRHEEAVRQSQYTGDFPIVNVSYAEGKASYKVYEPNSDKLILESDSPNEATVAALDWADQKVDKEEAQFMFLNSLMRASAQMVERRPESVKVLDTGEVMSRIKAVSQDPDQGRRLLEQAQMEEMRNGGDGSVAELVFGQQIYGSNRVSIDESGQTKIIDTIYKGGNIKTLIHEEGHAGFKEGIQSGVIDYKDTVNLLRKLDKVMGERMTKATSFGKDATGAQPLRFLSTDGEPSFTQVDEAVAELWEALILGEGRMGSMREFIKDNMKAYAEMGIGNTISNFVKALRHYFNLALTRAMAIKKAVRDGDIDKKDIDKFRAQMQGTTEQEQINGDAKKEFDESIRPAIDETSYEVEQASYEVGRATITPSEDTKVIQGADATVVGEASFSIGAWHGTPHKVDKFKTENIGTGEGAQAYGYGLYFAESRGVAEDYRKVLSGGLKYLLDATATSDIDAYMGNKIIQQGFSEADVNNEFEILEIEKPDSFSYDGAKNKASELINNGSLYQVELNVEQDELLDWDKPLSEQPKRVQKALKKLARKYKQTIDANEPVSDLYSDLSEAIQKQQGIVPQTGQEESALVAGKLASEALAELGIKGITYLDEKSRKVGEGTYNYVIFNDADIKITEENGKAVSMSDVESVSMSMGAVPDEIANSTDPIVKHIFLKEDGKFYQKMKDGYVIVDQSLDEFEGMAIMLHQPDGAMSGTVEVDGDQVVDGKGGVYYPVMFGDQGYFWASTRDAAHTMAKSLNAISKRNNGTILMALTSAPIEKMFSSTTMATGALNLFHTLAKNPKKYGVTKEELNKAIAKGSQATLVVTKEDKVTKVKTTSYKQFPNKLKETDSLSKNLKEMKKNLLPDASIFGQRGAFVQFMSTAIAEHMKLPTVEEVKKLDAKAKAEYEVKKQQALNIAALLASDKNLYNASHIPKGKLAKASVMQGMADLFAEPLVKTFQSLTKDKKSPSGRIYAVLEMKGEVEAYEADDHESYPFALRSTSGQTPIVHVLKNSNRWQDVVYAAPNKKNKDDKNEVQPLYDGNTNPVKKADESSMFPASAGVSMREMVVRKADEGVESLELSYSMADTARQGIMESVEDRVTMPEIKIEMLGDVLRNVQKLIDQKEKLEAEIKTVQDGGKSQAVVNLEEKLRQIEVEIDAMDQAYDSDVKLLESKHELRKGDIGEEIVAEFAHRIETAKPQKKKSLELEAKARQSERKKGEVTRFKLEKKNLKERLKTEKANLETEAEKVRSKLATKDAKAQRQQIRSMLVTYEAILMALNTTERGKMGSSVKLADIDTDEKILAFFDQKLDRLERVMDSYIGKRFNKSMKTLMKRATIKTKAGKKDKGKLKAQIHDVFQAAKDSIKMDEETLQAEIAKIEKMIESEELTGAEIDILKKQKIMMQLFGNWKNLTNPEKEAALVNGWREFEYNFTMSKLEQAEDRARRLAEIDEAIKSTGVSPDDANFLKDVKESEGTKLKSRLRSAAYGLVDFEQFLTKVFGKDSKVLEFVNREQAADAQKVDRMNKHQDAISDMFEEVAGRSNLGIKAAKLQYDMQNDRFLIESQKRFITQLQMIQARLMWRQADGRRHMEGRYDEEGNRITSWGYDQKFMDEIDSLMTPEARAVEEFLIEQYQDEWADLNAVHQRIQNATLPRNNMYAPLTVAPAIIKDAEVSDPDPITGQSIKTMKGSDGFLLRRNKGAVAEPVFRDALSTFLVHKTQVEHWMAYAEFNRDLATITGSREARKAVSAKSGAEGLKTLDGWSNVFANNGLQQSYADTELANFMNRAVSRTSQAILFGRLSVLAIQSTQLGAAAAQMPTMSYTKRLGMLMTGQLEFKKAFNSKFIQRRMQEAPPAVRLAMQNMASGKPNVARAAAEKMGTLIAGTDAFFTAGTYAIIFDYLTTVKGVAESDAHTQAERLTEQVAQPTRMGRKSLLEMQFSRQPTAKLAWAFASEPRQKMMLLAFNMSENGVLSKEAGRAAITTVVFGGVFASLVRTIAADIRDDDDEEVFDSKYWNPTRLALQSITAPFQGIPVFGEIAEYLLLSSAKGLGADTGYLFSGGDMLSGAGDMGLSGIKLAVSLYDLAQDNPDAEIEESIKHLDRFLSGMGVINNNAAAAASFSHLMKDLFKIGKNIAK